MGLKVLANVLKAAINADLGANTGALRWQGAMTYRLEVGAGLGKKIRTDGGRGRHLSNGRAIDSSWAEQYRDAFVIIVLVRAITDGQFRRT